MQPPPLLITMGDPAGVGPELALKGAVWGAKHRIPVAIVGSGAIFSQVSRALSLPSLPVFPIDAPASTLPQTEPWIYDIAATNIDSVCPGQVSSETGRISLACVEWAIAQSLGKRALGVVTGPIHKEAWHAAGCPFPGHTELLADRCGVPEHCMMLAGPTLRCALATVHVGLAEVPSILTTELIEQTIELAGSAVKKMLSREPRITVLGLNPHAGEGGLFGRGEEELLIKPAIRQASLRGWRIRGPVPPDTAFIPAQREQTDVYVCMYHDQGLIPLKALEFDSAVNVTLGLPIVRTSVDHGTALDLAWQGTASPTSMFAAIEMAWKLTQSPQK